MSTPSTPFRCLPGRAATSWDGERSAWAGGCGGFLPRFVAPRLASDSTVALWVPLPHQQFMIASRPCRRVDEHVSACLDDPGAPRGAHPTSLASDLHPVWWVVRGVMVVSPRMLGRDP